jgi:hypothetical protein
VVDLIDLVYLLSQLEGWCIVERGLQDGGSRRYKLGPVVVLLLDVVGSLPVEGFNHLLHDGNRHDGC